MNSSSNPVIDKKIGEREYSQGYVIPATKEQDKQNIAGEKKVLSQPYDVLDSSCGTAVQSGLRAEGKNDGSLTPLQFTIVAIEGLSTGVAVENDKSPNEIYKRVKENNKGKVVTPGN